MGAPVAAASADPTLPTLLFELGGVVLGLAVLARVARRSGFSPIPLYLLAGLAFGDGGVFDLGAARDFIEVGAEIGVILLLLMLGLEYSADELIANVRASAPAGALDVVLNFVPGLVAGLLLGWGLLPAAFLGGVTYISSSGVVAKLLADLGRLGNRETPSVLTVLVIEDLVMAVYLPLMAAIVIGGSLGETAATLALGLTVVGGVLLVALRYGDRVSALVFSRSSEVMLLTILGVTLLVAGLAERLQLSAAVGAFLVGIALSGDAAREARTVLLPLRNLFAAVFFVFFGFSVDPGQIPGVLAVAVALGAVTAVTKVVTGAFAAARSGAGRRGRLRAGLSLVARGEFSIIVATLGSAEEPELGAVAAAYVIVLAVVGPVLARFDAEIDRAIARVRPGRSRGGARQ